MATGSIKTMNGAVIAESISLGSAESSTYYKDVTKAVSKTGYTAVGVVGYQISSAAYRVYWAYITNGTVHIGITKDSGSIPSTVTVTAIVLWVRNDLL